MSHQRIYGICGLDWCGICGKSAIAHKRRPIRQQCVDLWIEEQIRAGFIQRHKG